MALSHIASHPEWLEMVMNIRGNQSCADCSSPYPECVSVNVGACICAKCCEVHRQLGGHVLKFGELTDEQVTILKRRWGNAVLNKKYEALLPTNVKKPNLESSLAKRLDYIRRKYELREFLDSNKSSPRRHHRFKQILGNIFPGKEQTQKRTDSYSSLGTVGLRGSFEVEVIEGKDLAVRDIKTSDPYVVLSLGRQEEQTKVIEKDLNPKWNEILMFDIPVCTYLLKLEVYDKDELSLDDKMGEVEINIGPFLRAVKRQESCAGGNDGGGIVGSRGERIMLERCPKRDENSLWEESYIYLVEGRVQQKIISKLQGVESGRVEIVLQSLSPPQ